VTFTEREIGALTVIVLLMLIVLVAMIVSLFVEEPK